MDINKENKKINTQNQSLNFIQNNIIKLNDDEKILRIKKYFTKIMQTLGLDILDDSLKNTPNRVSKMYVKEIFSGLNAKFNIQNISLFKNKYNFKEMLVQKNILLYSTCEHHFLPIIGKANIGYIPNKYIVGLSKINRIVNYFSRRPQVQERLTIQIVNFLEKTLKTKNIACTINAKHFCITIRGIKDYCSTTYTSEFRGLFKNNINIRNEFYNNIR